MDRRAELEKKRQKLMEIRELKKQRLEQREATTIISNIEPVAKDTSGSSLISSSTNTDLTDILNLCDSFDNKNRNVEPKVELTVPDLETSISTSEIKPSDSELVLPIPIDRNPISIPLTFSIAPQMSIAPSEQETYEKQTQTVITSTTDSNDEDDEDEDEVDTSSFDLSNDPKTQNNDQVIEKIETKPKRLDYKEQEKNYLMQSESFRKFLDRAIRITERSLSTMDSMDHEVDDEMDSIDSNLRLKNIFMDQRWSKNRAVTSFDWNTQYRELLLASYNQNDIQPNEPNGLCLVWNMNFPNKTTPEYVFHSPSPVMSACYAKFHPNLVLGGTYSGQICLWDNRVAKRVPVQSSRLSAKAHTHPIYCLKVVGTSNSHNLISISNDGTMCSWNLDMMSTPLETMVLREPNYKRRIQVMSMAFSEDDYNNFLLGSQNGSIYSANRHGTKTGILSVHQGHEGPVTSVDFHLAPTNSTQYDFSHLYLSTSFDWTFKLWSTQSGEKPLYTYEDGSDYMFDARWSPIHPALFATVDGLGKVDIWNLNRDTELPTVTTYVGEGGMSAPNRLSWSPNGQQLVVGDDGGRIVVYEVGEELALPKKDEWYRFSKTLRKFTSNEIV